LRATIDDDIFGYRDFLQPPFWFKNSDSWLFFNFCTEQSRDSTTVSTSLNEDIVSSSKAQEEDTYAWTFNRGMLFEFFGSLENNFVEYRLVVIAMHVADEIATHGLGLRIWLTC